jgi:large subunit ribosomal protein L18Ae
VFAKNAVLASSKFWYQMKRQNKVRRTQGEIVSVSEIFEKTTNSIKNYGVVLRYQSRTGVINMYKEFRSNSLCNAISQLYQEMSGRHSARSETIHIIKTVIVPDAELKRAACIQFAQKSARFPKITQIKRAPTAAHQATFTASRPTVI